MSFERPHRGGGNRRRYRDDYDDRRRETFESPADKLKTAIIKLGDIDANDELVQIEKQIRDHTPLVVANISEAIRISVTEQPYKIPYYATLVRRLHDPAADAPESEDVGPSLGRQILEDFWKGFHAYLDQLAWRETRLCIHFFAHLTVAKLISTDSMIALLQSLTAVLEEFGVSQGRAKKAAVCAAEGLMIGGPILKATSPTQVEEIIHAIQAYNESAVNTKSLVTPTYKIGRAAGNEHSNELLDMALQALQSLNDTDFAATPTSFLQPYSGIPDLDPATFSPYNLPSVLVPPEVIELDTLSSESGEDAQVKKEEWPEYFVRLFDNEITADPTTPAGYAVHSALRDIADIFEVNRKESARLLLEYPRWTVPGTFKPKPGAAATVEPVPGKDWQLESTIIENVLGAYFILPESSQKSVYYIALVTDLCKLSASTVGPAVGKSIRKLYGLLDEGLDVEVARRFSEWFAVHMSNFGFQWVWKEWVPDLSLSMYHPKRTFMQRALELEVRLAYHDRILKTLPAEMQAPESAVISEEAPAAWYEYDDSAGPHHEAAQSVLNLFRGRAVATDVIAHLDGLKATLEDDDKIIRSIVVQSLLNVGSRSFSHLLNAIERYLPLLRNLAAAGGEAKLDILRASAVFWKNNRHMVVIVFDKLMQYQIVDPTDVVAWVFSTGQSFSAFEWDVLRGALDKAVGRVVVARKRVVGLRKEDDEKRARVNAGDDEAMEVDTQVVKTDESAAADSPALATAVKAFTSLTREQKTALSRTIDGFADLLMSSDVTKLVWEARMGWTRTEWDMFEAWGWFRHFCRVYAPYLRNYSETLYTVSLAKFEGASDPAAELLRKTWSIATGQE